MARISSYQLDGSLSGEDRLLGSSYEGEGQSGPIYKTRTYKLSELGAYVSTYVNIEGINLQELYTLINGNTNSISLISTTVTDNSVAIATANQSLTVITNELLAQATFQTNLAASFGVFDEFGNLISFSEATANQILQVTTSDRFAEAIFATNLAASVGVYDENGNLITLSEAFANQVLSATTTDRFATSTFVTNLAASFGTYNPDGSLAIISESFANQLLQASTSSDFADAQFVTNLMSNFGTFDENGNILTISTSYADQLLQTANTAEFAQASFVTNLASSFGTYDANGNLLTISSSFADDVLSTANTAEFAQASKLTALGASFGTVNPDGSVSFSNTSTYSNAILNYVDSSSSLATQVSNLQTTVTNIPQTIRQDDPPAILDGNNDLIYPLGSIWIDTNDANAIYILIEDAGDPTGYAWSPTTSEALGDLILSNAALQDEVTLLSNNLSSEATKLTTLTAQFGVYDPVTNTFAINNNAAVVSDLRTYADAESSAATKVDSVGSTFGAFNPTTNAFTVSNAKLETIVDTLTLANYASTTRVDTLEAEVDDNAAAIQLEQQVRTTQDEAIALQIQTLQAEVDDNGAAIELEQQVRATGDSALSSQISTVSSNVGGLTTTVQQHTTSINGIEGRYGVTIDQNGNIAGFQLLNGQGGSAFNVSVDAFNIYSGTTNANVFSVDAGQVKLNVPLNGVSGTFTGRLTAGAVDIYSDNIAVNIDSLGGQIKFIDDAGNDHTTLTASGPTGNFIVSCAESISLLSKDGAGNNASSLQLRKDFATLFTPGGSINLTTSTGILATASGESAGFSALGFDSFIFYAGANRLQGSSADGITILSGSNTLTVNTTGVYVNGQAVTGGGPTSDTNYYLQGVSINNSSGVITFDMNGTTDKTLDISTYVSSVTPNLSGYAALSGATFTGNVIAPDFVLSSDATLKENIKDYTVKPINIQYKEYNLIGDDSLRVGVIAQELEKDHPEFVKITDNGTKAVSYIDMLVAKVAELEQRIKQLENGAA